MKKRSKEILRKHNKMQRFGENTDRQRRSRMVDVCKEI
jgi:hypothetical protein